MINENNIDEIMQAGVLVALTAYLFAGAFFLGDMDNTSMIVGAFLGYLGANARKKAV